MVYLSCFYFNIKEILTMLYQRDSPGGAGVNQLVVQLPSSGISISLTFSSFRKHYRMPSVNPIVGRFLLWFSRGIQLSSSSSLGSFPKPRCSAINVTTSCLIGVEHPLLPTKHSPGCAWHRWNELAFFKLFPILRENTHPHNSTVKFSNYGSDGWKKKRKAV